MPYRKDSTASKFGQTLVANSAKQTVRKQQLRNRLRAKLGKPPVECEVQINGHGANIARVNVEKEKEQFQVEGGDEVGYVIGDFPNLTIAHTIMPALFSIEFKVD